MELNNQPNNRSPVNKHIKRSSYITEIENERNLRIANLQHSRKQLSYSTFLDLHQVQVPITPTTGQFQRKEKDLSPRNQELIRARSLKTIADHKPILQTAEKTTNDLTENMVRLKVQQMTFKYKTKISCLLKEMNVSANDLIRFNNISKTEEILNFLSLKVRERIIKTQITEENFIKARSKSKEAVKEHEVQIEILRRKMAEKQNIEKELKSKLRDSQAQARDLLNTINQKEKELSLRMDQLYQQKMILTQQQKLIARLQATCEELQLQNKSNIKIMNTESNDIVNINKELEEQNGELVAMMDEFKEEIEQYKDKQNKLVEINRQLNEEVTRWRQRYEDGPLMQTDKDRSESNGEANAPLTPSALSMKNSTMSMSNFGFAQFQIGNSRRFSSTPVQIENMRLITKVQELQKKKKQLTRDILNYSTIKERYQKTLAAVDEQNYDLTKGLDPTKIQKYKQSSVDLYKVQLQAHYQKKIEEVAKSWKEKLYELVHKYEDQLQDAKEQIDKLQSEKEDMERKILNLANQKYNVQTRLIERQREIYDMTRILSINSIYYEPKAAKEEVHSNSILLSENQIKPIELSQVKEVSNESPEIRKDYWQQQDKLKIQNKQGDFV